MRRLVVALALSLAACGGPKDPVDRLLADLESAAEDRDPEEIGRHLAPGFRAAPMDRAATVAEARRWLALYQGVDVMVSEVERVPPSTLRFRADFSGRPKDLPGLQGVLPAASAFRFEVQTAAGPDGTLQLSSATWERVAMPGEAGP